MRGVVNARFLFAPPRTVTPLSPVDMGRAEHEEEALMDRLEAEIAQGAQGRVLLGRKGSG